jgi:hypothetical protein
MGWAKRRRMEKLMGTVWLREQPKQTERAKEKEWYRVYPLLQRCHHREAAA